MHERHLKEMLQVLQPAVKSQRKAEQILRSYWRDRMALVWTIDHVHRAANEKKTVLTDNEARKLLHELHHHHNHQYGIKWEDLTDLVLESGLGRNITKQELSRFIHHDQLAIQKPTK